jgi:hypothetical protein
MPSKLRIVAVDPYNCLGGHCPTLYKSDDGKLYVQGFVVNGEVRALVDIPAGEDLVEISPGLVAALKSA